MNVQSSSRDHVEIDLTQESGDDTDFTAEEDTEEEDDVKMEDISEAASSSSKPEVVDHPADPELSVVMEEVEEDEDDDESTGSSDSLDDLLNNSNSKQTTPDLEEPSTSQPGPSARVHQDESGKAARFIKYNQGVELEERGYVSDSWSELGEEEEKQESTEALEAVIAEHFKEALAALRANKRDKALRILLNILANPIVSQEFQVDQWMCFDWASARAKTNRASNLSKIFFSTNVAIAELVENPVPFYIQALSVRPEIFDLWYECGKAAAKLRDWPTSEFCFKQCNKDEFRAWESLLLLHFLQDNFHECFFYLQKIFAQCKDHRLAHYIRCCISESGALWREFCIKTFVGPNFEKCMDQKFQNQIAGKIANFTTKSAKNSGNVSINPFAEILSHAKSYAPLRLSLDLDMKVEQLGSVLCDAFDRIEAFSLISEQSVIVVEKKDDSNLLMSADDDTDVVERAHHIELYNQPCVSFLEDCVDPSDIFLQCAEEILDDIIDAVVGEKEYVTIYSSKQNPLTTPLHKNKSNKNLSTAVSKNTRRVRRQWAQDGSSNNINVPLFGDDSVHCRRSTRFVEDLDASQFTSVETGCNTNKCDLLRLMGIPRTLEAPASPLSRQLSIGTARNSLNSSVDCLVDVLVPLPSVRLLAQQWVDTSGMGIQLCLFGYLKWIAVDLQEECFYSITVHEADIFRQVYIRWSDTFISPLKNVSTAKISWEEMCIHLLAAELGSNKALSILQTYFSTREATGARNTNVDVEPQKSVSSSSIQTPKNSRSVLQRVDVSLLAAISEQSEFPENEMKMMVDLLNRMLEEKNTSSSSGAINATIQRLQRHSVSERVLGEEAMDQSSSKSCSPQPSPTFNPFLQRIVEIRYLWLIAQLKPEEIGLPAEGSISFLYRYINMLELVVLMRDGERVQSHANFGNGCISLLNASGLLYEQWRQFNAQQIDHLKETKQYEELQYALLHHFDWSEASEEAQIEHLFLLVECALETDYPSLAAEYLLTILKRLHQRVLPQMEAKKELIKSLNFFETKIPLAKLSDALVCGLGKVLAEMAYSDQFYSYANIWMVCHKIAKYREGDLKEAELEQFYEETTALQQEDEPLPTKALMVLMKAHEALGEAQKCDQEEGKFLRFFLYELAETMSSRVVQKVLAFNPKYSVIVENVQVEVYQCINCAFSECKSLRKYDDHASQCKWVADWKLAHTVLPLLMPRTLPLVYSLEKVSPDFVEIISRVFKFVLEVEPELETRLLAFCQQPPVMELKEVLDPDGIAVNYADEYQTAEDPRNLLTQQSKQYLLDVSEERRDQLVLSAQCLYLSSLAQYRNNINNKELLKVIRCCLAIAHPHLDSQLQSSIWYMYARNLANEYIMLPSHELLESVDQFLFPFKMSIYLKPDFCEAHLDIATVTYQVRTRIKRFSSRNDVEEGKKKAARRKMDGMLLKCKVHFELVRKHNDSPAELPWLSTYFLAKIAEKLGESVEKIGSFYHQSALALEQEGYLYPQKIHRSKQINFEPLEIHYKMHSYALKKMNEWRLCNKHSLQSSLHMSLPTLHALIAYLRLFAHHGVETKTASAQLFLENPDLSLAVQQESPAGSLEAEVQTTVRDMSEAVDLQGQIYSTCMNAFETIVGKFPHYKACYRMAKYVFVRGDNKGCSDLLFDHLLLPAAKKRGNGPVSSALTSTLFENVVEISRADIERSGSFAYHIHKILHLAIISSYKCYDVGRLVLLLSSLVSLHNEEQAPDKMVREDIKNLQTMCYNAINRIACLPKMNTDKLAHNCSLLQELLKKLKKENYESTTELENCLVKCLEKRAAWINKQRAAMEQAARKQQQEQQRQHEVQAAELPAEKRSASSPPPLDAAKKREWEKIAVITLPESPPRPSKNIEAPPTSTTTHQQEGFLKAAIKQHLLQKSAHHQQQLPKKAVKRALDCQKSQTKQLAPPNKVGLVSVSRDSLSKYFEEVLARMSPENSAQVVSYIHNPNIGTEDKKRYVTEVLESAGFVLVDQPHEHTNGNGIATTSPAYPPQQQQQQQGQATQPVKPRKRKVVLPRDPRLQAFLSPSPSATPIQPSHPGTLQTSSTSSLSPFKTIPKPAAPAAFEVTSSFCMPAKPAQPEVASKPKESQPTDPNKPKRPRIQAPCKDAPKSVPTKTSAIVSPSLPQMGKPGQNLQDLLRLATSMQLPASSLAALQAVAANSKKGRPSALHNNPAAAMNLSKQVLHTDHKPAGLVGASKPCAQKSVPQTCASHFTAPSTHIQWANSQPSTQQFHTQTPSNKTYPKQPTSSPLQSIAHLFPSPFNSPASSHSPRAPSHYPFQRLTLPLKQVSPSTSKAPNQPVRLDLQTVVSKQRQRTPTNQVPRTVPASHSSSSNYNTSTSLQPSNQLTQAQMQAHIQLQQFEKLHQLEKLQQYVREQQQQGQQQSYLSLVTQHLGHQLAQQNAANMLPLQSAGISRKPASSTNVEQGLAEIARRFELQKLAFEKRSLQEQGGRRN